MYQLNAIGTIEMEMTVIRLQLKRQFRRGLKFTELFSHVHIFYAQERGNATVLAEKIMEILSVDKKSGTVKLVCEDWMIKRAFIFDLKPYIPCEDSVRTGNDTSHSDSMLQSSIRKWESQNGQGVIPEIGKVKRNHGEMYIQLNSDYPVCALEQCTHIKLVWWFHKFDRAVYRKCVECYPPYENAPRTGVFASRSPVRPNPLAMTVTKVLRFDSMNGRIYIQDAECFDMTPCLAIWPYEEQSDLRMKVRVAPWMQQWPEWLNDNSADTVKGKLDLHTKSSREVPRLYDENYKEEWEKMLTAKTQNKNTGIIIKGARENNLKGIHCSIPYGKITAVAGVSGSGKSSLVHDTIYSECKRRMELLSGYDSGGRKPKVDSMSGVIPAVLISQKEIGKNSRSTVGTYSNAYEYLRLIYALCGIRYCPQCRTKINTTTHVCSNCKRLVMDLTPSGFQYTDPESMCPVCNGTGVKQQIDLSELVENPELSILDGASSWWGKLRNFMNQPNANWTKGQVIALAQEMNVNLELPWRELPEQFRYQLLYGSGSKTVTFHYKNKNNGRNGEICRPVEGVWHIVERLCLEKDNAVLSGKLIKKVTCDCCDGERLNAEARLVSIGDMRYPRAAGLTFSEMLEWCRSIPKWIIREEAQKIKGYVQKLFYVSQCAEKLGIGYLELSRNTSSLSGGESQRLKLLNGFENQLSGILYVLDEPSKGLHPKDYGKVADLMYQLKENGNTVLMVEHNVDMIRIADWLIEIGPGAGEKGGYLIAQGDRKQLLKEADTQTVKYIRKEKQPVIYRKKDLSVLSWMRVHGANYHNLKHITVKIPIHAMTCVCGVSGSGKSSLVNGVLFNNISRLIKGNRKLDYCNGIDNAESFRKVVMVEQSAIGKTPRCVPATYMGIMDQIRERFAMSPQAVQQGVTAAEFSFNNSSGQCPGCRGAGQIQLGFSQDIWVTCPSCKGQRYQKKVLSITHQGKNIYEVLQMSIDEAVTFFKDTQTIYHMLKTLQEVGLGYIRLGQSSTTLSGGEASRLKLAKELTGNDNTDILYLIDEPTTGLHDSDVENLLRLFQKLIDNKNTIILIEHNKQVLTHCDYVIELGPGAGSAGGYIVSGKL